jgi:hypothetical protein
VPFREASLLECAAAEGCKKTYLSAKPAGLAGNVDVKRLAGNVDVKRLAGNWRGYFRWGYFRRSGETWRSGEAWRSGEIWGLVRFGVW